MGQRGGTHTVLMREPEGERSHMEDLGVDMRIILKWVFKKQDGGGVDWIDLAQERDRVAGFGEHGIESSGSVKCDEFLV
jgi:hypothetical protein